MKAIATILALLVVATGGFAYKTSEALKASNQKLDRLQIKFQVLSERFDEREESLASIGLDSIQVPSADPVTGEIKVPEGLVSAVAMQIAQNSSALGAIAKEISSPTPVSDGPPLESNQLDQQVRDTIAAGRIECKIVLQNVPTRWLRISGCPELEQMSSHHCWSITRPRGCN